MVFGLHPTYAKWTKYLFGKEKAFARLVQIMGEWGEGLDVEIYRAPEVPQMLSSLHATYESWEGTLCQREASTLIHGDMHLGNMVFDAKDENLEPILLDWCVQALFAVCVLCVLLSLLRWSQAVLRCGGSRC